MARRVAAVTLLLLAKAWAELESLPEDCEDSECSLSLRQLRGEQTLAAIAEHREREDPFDEPADIDSEEAESKPTRPREPVADRWGNMTQEAWEEKQGGMCCFAGDDPSNVCGTCFPSSVASYKNSCSRKSTCGSCGGSWCEPKCVMGAADPNNKCGLSCSAYWGIVGKKGKCDSFGVKKKGCCSIIDNYFEHVHLLFPQAFLSSLGGTAFETGTAKSDTYCGKSSKNCASCNGEWCKRGITKQTPKVEGKPSPVNAVSSASGFCCYRGDGLAKNMCGGCADISQDAACTSVGGCSSCGGTWCPGPRCIKASKDKADPCNTAFGPDSVASEQDYCSKSEEHCGSCHGAWCAAYNISFVTGEKFDPSKPLKMPGDDEEDEDVDDVEEVADPGSAETISELFPDGLPHKKA